MNDALVGCFCVIRLKLQVKVEHEYSASNYCFIVERYANMFLGGILFKLKIIQL